MAHSRERDPIVRQLEEAVRTHLDAQDARASGAEADVERDLLRLRASVDSLRDIDDADIAAAMRDVSALVDVLANRFALASVPAGAAAQNLRGSLESLLSRVRELELEKRNLETLNSVALMLTRETDVDRLLENVMDTVIEVAGGERGFLVLLGDKGDLDIPVARNVDRVDVQSPEFAVSRSIIDSVIQRRESLCLTNAVEDERFAAAVSVRRLALRSVVCVPLVSDERVVGVIYMENSLVAGLFTEQDVALLNALGRQIAAGIEKALLFRSLKRREHELALQLRDRYRFDHIIGNSPALTTALKLTAEVAETDATVLITGESGTGKELFARAIHVNSRRAERAFVALNCAAIPEHLLESELFGHVKGAFTGATESKAGKFEVADGGTLFMDEIGDMSQPLQAKVLRALQEREIERVGANRVERVDVRIIAATNRDLRALVREGKFREDLFHRLNVITILLPPLRDRRDDILPLAERFLAAQARELGRDTRGFSTGAIRCLMHYSFPGNVRELENVVKRAAILVRGPEVTEAEFPDYVRLDPVATPGAPADIPQTNDELLDAKRRAKEAAYEAVERPFLEDALRRAGGHVSHAAQQVGMNRVQFHGLMKKYGLDARRFRPRAVHGRAAESADAMP